MAITFQGSKKKKWLIFLIVGLIGVFLVLGSVYITNPQMVQKFREGVTAFLTSAPQIPFIYIDAPKNESSFPSTDKISANVRVGINFPYHLDLNRGVHLFVDGNYMGLLYYRNEFQDVWMNGQKVRITWFSGTIIPPGLSKGYHNVAAMVPILNLNTNAWTLYSTEVRIQVY